MTAPHVIDPAGLLGEALSQASPDLMRSSLQHVINGLFAFKGVGGVGVGRSAGGSVGGVPILPPVGPVMHGGVRR